MKICFFGSYDKNYSKNTVLLKGLKKHKIKVAHCFHPQYFSFVHYPSLFLQFVRKGRDSDIIFVAFFGHYDVWFATLIGKLFRKKVVFDPLISIYNTRVEDRKYFSPESLRAKFYIFFDWFNVHLADYVFLDSNAHFKYYNKKFSLKENKVFIIRTGADESILKPGKRSPNKKFRVLFYGSYQPSQGTMKIIQTAHLLRDKPIYWTFIGNGQDRSKVEKFAQGKNLGKVKFVDPMPFNELAKQIDDADVLFGVFGNTVKTRIVIHNKIYQSIALGKPLITQKTEAVEEILTHGYNVILAKPDPKDMSSKLLGLYNNKSEVYTIGKNARSLFLKKFSSEKIAKQAAYTFDQILKS